MTETEDSENATRDEIVQQLKKSLADTWKTLSSGGLSVPERKEWTRIHSYIATCLNAVLRDSQNRDWEKRLKEVERLSKSIRIARRVWKGLRPEPYRPWTILGLPLGKTIRRTRRNRRLGRTGKRH